LKPDIIKYKTRETAIIKGPKEEISQTWSVSEEEQFAASQHGPLRSAELYSRWDLVGIDLAVLLHRASLQTYPATVQTCGE
jgi:hypothetical protein